MAEEKTLENRILLYLIFFLILIGFFIVYKGVFLRPSNFFPIPPEILPKIKINYEVLEDPRVKGLLPFEKIFKPEEVGRENPFEKY